MKIIIKTLLVLTTVLANLNGNAQSATFKAKQLYKSSTLTITQIAEHSFQHTSLLQTNDFGTTPCNGLVVRSGNEVMVFDTPTTNESAEELIKWVKDKLHCSIKAVIPTHFHEDCLGGLKVFHQHEVPSYAYVKTIKLVQENNLEVPKNSFKDSLSLKMGNDNVILQFFGEGHTKDNVVAYFPKDHVLFGGCLIKELAAGKGFLGDANLAAWPTTVENLKKSYPNVKIVVPGHGAYGDRALLDYTIKLFRKQ